MSWNLSPKLRSTYPTKAGLTMRKQLRHYSLTVTLAITTVISTACVAPTPSNISNQTTNPAPTATAKVENLPLVVATNSVICDITKQIARETINLKCLIEGGVDPHIYQPKPDDRKAIDSANLILYGGYGFEPSLSKLISASSNAAPKIAVHEIAVPDPLIFEGVHSHDHGDEKKEDGKEIDPHIWNNAQHGIKIAQTINQNLSKLRPDQAETYSQNTAKLTSDLAKIDAWIKVQIATIPKASRKLITTHDALGYYAQAYDIPVLGALNGVSTDEQPTPTRVKELVDLIKSSQVPTIFAEVSINPKLITTVAKEANVKIADQQLYTDGLGAKGSASETYTGMLIKNTQTIVEGLGGKFTPLPQ
ncbi:MAG: zinc ABC transporter substrate-binding protein [Pseudanabaenaceae cyanobacterium bins.39]|nr:zinc ABC transporter substrate-binding protein [Pseudanabaenaceae cyanobacterium bins.39]